MVVRVNRFYLVFSFLYSHSDASRETYVGSPSDVFCARTGFDAY